jgi:hypothetical protein
MEGLRDVEPVAMLHPDRARRFAAQSLQHFRDSKTYRPPIWRDMRKLTHYYGSVEPPPAAVAGQSLPAPLSK